MEHEFNLDAPIENLDAVPAEFRGYYSQTDAGYTVSEAAVPLARAYNGLTSNLKTTRASLSKVNKESADRRGALAGFDALFDGIEGVEERTPDTLKAHMASLVEAAKKGGKTGEAAAEEIERIKRTMTEAHTTQLGEVQGKLDAANATIRGLMIDSGIKAAVAAAGGNPQLLTPMLSGEMDLCTTDEGKQVVVILGPDKEPRYSNSGDLLTIAERVEELKADDSFAAAFTGRVQGGSDTPPGKKVASRQGTGDPAEKTGKQLIRDGLRKRRGRG